MNHKLIILTRRFPYFKTEAFLESELPVLAKEFREIIIYPSETGSFSRQVPGNVKVDKTFAVFYGKKMTRILKTLFSPYFWSLFLKYIRKGKFYPVYIFIFSSRVLRYREFFNKNQKEFDNALVYSYWLNEAPVAFAYSRQQKKFNSLIIARAHRYDIYEEGIDLVPFWPERQFLLKHIDKVFVISENGKKYLDKKYGAELKTTVSKLGVFDYQAISPASDAGFFNVVSVSRIDPVKRVEKILHSLNLLAEKLENVEVAWTHFGSGSLFEKLSSEAKENRRKNLKIHLKGLVDNSLIYTFYKESPVDCFINLSSSEGIPVSIMEAQSFGIPTVATDVGGTSEIVTDATGILLSANPEIEEAIEALLNIYMQKPDRQKIKDYWNNNFNAELNYRQFSKELRQLSESLNGSLR